MKKDKTDKLSLEVNSPYDRSLNVTMLIDDFKFSKYRVKDGKLKIETKYDLSQISEPEIVEKIRSIFNIHKSFWKEELNEILLTIVENIWQELISEGYCALEKVKLFESNDVVLLAINGIHKFKRKSIIQKPFIHEGGAKRIEIPLDKCYILKFPDEICNYKEYRNILTEIKIIDKKEPMFSVLNPTKLNEAEGYDYVVHREKLSNILFSITKNISWDFRTRYSNEFSDYYIMRRNLLFKKNKLILFNHVTNFIKKIFKDFLPEVKIDFKFYKSISDIEKEITKLESGNYSQEEFTNVLIGYI